MAPIMIEIRTRTQILLLARHGLERYPNLLRGSHGAMQVGALLRCNVNAVGQLRYRWVHAAIHPGHAPRTDMNLIAEVESAIRHGTWQAVLLPLVGVDAVAPEPPITAVPTSTGRPAGPVADWSLADRLRVVGELVMAQAKRDMKAAIHAFFAPENLAVVILVARSMAALHAASPEAGLMVDATLVGLVVGYAGVKAVGGLVALGEGMADVVFARSDLDLKNAAECFLEALSGLSAALTLLVLHKLAGRVRQGTAAKPVEERAEEVLPGRPVSKPSSSTKVIQENAIHHSGIPINGAQRTVPLGFAHEAQFLEASKELSQALHTSGINDATIGVRGSSVTGYSLIKGTSFNVNSDIDFFIESNKLTEGYKTSKNIPGFVHPNKILPDYPLLQNWAEKWSNILSRDITPGAFTNGMLPEQPAILVK